MTFSDFNFSEKLLDGLDSMGYENPTPIQEQAIPLIMEGKDLIACAQTGTGKTAAYLLPVIDRIIASDEENASTVSTLILAPTRELAQQIDQQVEGFAYFLSVSSIPVYGGGDGSIWDQQKKAFQMGADIIIATPGRLIAHINSGNVNLKSIRYLILDEADRMLDMGFQEDINRIIRELPEARQTLLFSATMPPKIRDLAKRILKDPEQINIAVSKPAANIVQQAFMTYDHQKTALLVRLLSKSEMNSVIIFTSTKDTCKQLEKEMKRSKMKVGAIHSDLEQKEREELIRDFKNRQFSFLIGTDIISRGIDIDGIEMVVNYDVPPDPEDYIHRIGRTARAEGHGIGITFINDRDQAKFKRIEDLIEKEIPKFPVPEELGEAPVYNPKAKSKGFTGKRDKGRGSFRGNRK